MIFKKKKKNSLIPLIDAMSAKKRVTGREEGYYPRLDDTHRRECKDGEGSKKEGRECEDEECRECSKEEGEEGDYIKLVFPCDLLLFSMKVLKVAREELQGDKMLSISVSFQDAFHFGQFPRCFPFWSVSRFGNCLEKSGP